MDGRVRKHHKEIMLLVRTYILLPSVDIYTDMALIIVMANLPGGLPLSFCLLLPQAANTVFTYALWKRLEPMETRHWSWIMVFLQLWPQVIIAFCLFLICL